MYDNYGNYDGGSEGPGIRPVYEKLLIKLAKAELIIHTRGNNWNRLERHLDHVKAAQSLVREAAIHDASDLPERAKANLGQAIDRLGPVVMSAYNDTVHDNNKQPDYESQVFHDHISKFVTKAAKHLKQLPDQEDWDN